MLKDCRFMSSLAPRVLITGLEPFGGDPRNVSYAVIETLRERQLNHVVLATLPVSYRRAGSLAVALLEQHEPSVVLALGQAAGRVRISTERVARNYVLTEAFDNDGWQMTNGELLVGGPSEHETTLPSRNWLAFLHQLAHPSRNLKPLGLLLQRPVLRSPAGDPGLGYPKWVHPLPIYEASTYPSFTFQPLSVLTQGLEIVVDVVRQVS